MGPSDFSAPFPARWPNAVSTAAIAVAAAPVANILRLIGSIWISSSLSQPSCWRIYHSEGTIATFVGAFPAFRREGAKASAGLLFQATQSRRHAQPLKTDASRGIRTAP